MSSQRVRTRQSPEKRAEQIFLAAVALALESGLNAVTLRAVARRAEVATSLVAHYHSSMDALLASTFRHIVAAEKDEVENLLSTVPSSEAQAAFLFSTLLDDARHDVTLVWVEAWVLGRRNDELAAVIEEQMDAWHGVILEVINRGLRDGVFRTDEPDLVAWQLLGMIDGLAAHALVRGADGRVFATQLARAGEALLGAAPGSLSPR
jgi:AcrR family transcriptional regulator